MRGFPIQRPQNRAAQFRGSSVAPAEYVADVSEYYSRFVLLGTKDGANNFIFSPGVMRAFGYGLGDSMAPAVLGSLTRNASEADTNVVKAASTNDGEEFFIEKFGVLLDPNTDVELLRALDPELSISIKFGQSTQKLMGSISQNPGGGGFAGTGRQDISAANATQSIIGNGWADYANMRDISRTGIVWQPDGNPESNLNVLVQLHNSVTVAGVAGSPATLRVSGKIRLVGYARRARGRNL